DVATLDPSELFKTLSKPKESRLCVPIILCQPHQNADVSIRNLRPCRHWPGNISCRRPAEQQDELATLHLCAHSITSSARAMNVGVSSRPSALAVFRLTARSNLVGNSTGKSAGFVPCRILCT